MRSPPGVWLAALVCAAGVWSTASNRRLLATTTILVDDPEFQAKLEAATAADPR
jgi:hypothetical protein